MTDLQKGWLIDMFDREIKELETSISNYNIWIHGSKNTEEIATLSSNVYLLEEYKEFLLGMTRQLTEEGTLHVE